MDTNDIYNDIIRNYRLREQRTLNRQLATFSKHAKRKHEDDIPDRKNIRPPFCHDVDRITHCNAYSRYMDKTQVFFQIQNDHITRRALHVQMVSRIARTLGRFFRLNEDLIEAIAVGHDLGHTPFGHAGEEALAKILESKNCGSFVHNAHSIRVLSQLEKKGRGLNLTIQVLDGILGHNGELESQQLTFDRSNLNWGRLDNDLEKCLSQPRSEKYDKHVFPSSLEGCIVRVSDIIAYLGRDFEDAITLKLIRRADLPLTVTKILGNTNREIIDSICRDILHNSYNQPYLKMSEKVFKAFSDMKKFNYEKIYGCKLISIQKKKFEKMVKELFDSYLDDLRDGCTSSAIYQDFLDKFETDYMKVTMPERIVADFIAGMTDQYFLSQYHAKFIPQKIDYGEYEILKANINK